MMIYEPARYASRSFAIECYVHQEGLTEANAKRQVLMDELMQAVGARKCKKDGHKLVSIGYGGPESGTDGAECKRCGYSWFVRMY